MQWLETLHIQTSVNQQAFVSERLQRLIHDLLNQERVPGLLSVEAFRHPIPAGEHFVIMRWGSEDMPREGSALGIHIKEIVNQYGLVEHTIWLSLK